MSNELKALEAGEYVLVARLVKGVYRGALWHASKIDQSIEGSSLEEVYRKLESLLLSAKWRKRPVDKALTPPLKKRQGH